MEAIKEIKKSEDKAKAMINDALSQKTAVLKEAEKEAEKKYHNIIEASKEESKAKIDSAILQGEKEAEPIYKKGDEEVKSILNIKDSKLQEAVNLIIEKVVNVNGNS